MQPDPLETSVSVYLDWMALQNYSPLSIRERRRILGYFTKWCRLSGISDPLQITRANIEGWQIHLHHHRKKDGHPLSIGVQHNRLVQLQAFFRWLHRKGHLRSNPASDIELPTLPARLPLGVLSASEIEAILRLPDVAKPGGLRDRALLELLWSTGIRRREAADLSMVAVDWDRGVLKVSLGKGGRDRVVPVGLRALHWLKRYRDEGRPEFDPGACSKFFVNSAGQGFSSNGLGNLVRAYLVAAGHGAAGSCHVFRHAMATAMLDHGADIRFVQEMLGHQRLETTRIYTHVSIEKLKAVHRTTHPSEIGWIGQAVASSFQSTVSPGVVITLRRSLDLDQPSFARVLNVPTKALTNLEAGRTSPKGAVLRLFQILSRDPALARTLRDSVQGKTALG